MTLSDPLRERPVLSYFALVFCVAWGAVVVVVGPGGLVGGTSPTDWQVLSVLGAMLLGPAVAGLGMIALTDGRAGLREVWTRQRRWRVGGRWYAIALSTTPVLLLSILGGLSVVSPAFTPRPLTADDVVGIVAVATVYGLFAGFVEEAGWTGFALPRLRRRYSLLVSGLVLGILWGAWHGLADYWGTHAEFGAYWLARITLWTAALAAYRLLMVWVYENTGSLLVAQLMHTSFTGSQALLVPAVTPANHFVWYATFTVALWALVVGLLLSVRDRPPEARTTRHWVPARE